MFEIGFAELFLLGVIALLVVGPDRLPALARTVGVWVGRAQRLVGQVRADIEREVRADELRRAAKEYSPAGMVGEVRKEMEDFASEVSKPVDIGGEKDGEKSEAKKSGTEADGSQDAPAAVGVTESVPDDSKAHEEAAGGPEGGGEDPPNEPEAALAAEVPAAKPGDGGAGSAKVESAEPHEPRTHEAVDAADDQPDGAGGAAAADGERSGAAPDCTASRPVIEGADAPPAKPDERSAAA